METLLNILGNIGFNWKVALANLVNFLIIFWLLNKFIFSIIRKNLSERKAKIEQGVEDAQKAETALMMAEEEKKGILKEAQIEAGAIAEDAFKKAKRTVEDSKKDAEKEAQVILKEADKTIEKKKAELEKELHRKTADMVVDGVRKIMVDEMDASLQSKIVTSLTS